VREAVSETTLDDNTRCDPNNLLHICTRPLAPLWSPSRATSAEQQAPSRPTPSTRKARPPCPRRASVRRPPFVSRLPLSVQSRRALAILDPSLSSPRLAIKPRTAPAPDFSLPVPSRNSPRAPSWSATAAASVASHPRQRSAARVGERDRRAISVPLTSPRRKNHLPALCLCLAPTDAERFAQARLRPKIAGQDTPQAYPESPLYFGPSLAGKLSR
jgi:hypothetical protein